MSQQYDNRNRGVLFKNDRKAKDAHPDYKGRGNYGGQDFEVAAWITDGRNGKYLKLSFQAPYQREERQEQRGDDDDVAF